MNKKILVIASVLKPVNDARNYEKTAISIGKSGNYQIHLVGQKVQELPKESSLYFDPLFSFSRLSIKRFFTSWIFLRYLFKVKADIVIITTFELLVPAVLYKIIRAKKLIYDVQENYFRNLIYTNSFPIVLKQVMAAWVRGLEWTTRPFINQYILAEKNYEMEFSFSKGKSIVLENKLPKTFVKKRKKREDDFIQLIYTGTISENYGIFEVVNLAKQLYLLDDRIRLKIIGFSSKREIVVQLENKIKGVDFIKLIGGNSIVPHDVILTAIAEADFGLVAYRSDKSTENCIPTKLYEYLAHQLPYIISFNPVWNELTERYKGGIEIDFLKPDALKIIERMKSEKFYTLMPGEEIYWNESFVDSILK
ncbi:MAG TPA: hypothetical protein VK766_03215 [Cytophagaceae bacterium]|jgi:glycosyltransferase involved in cell wall biosynthesis|nr:hypothetical protein [Cytophagaceae bacterium]